ncbi:MAG: PIG-L family deacetylase [Candidatus Coatesbacteria bacterium]|nr:PIG-L family deacetylase [Candidatus Coatesbacteria bacterium]
MSKLQALRDLRAKVKYLGAERLLGFLSRMGIRGKSELFLPQLIDRPEANRVLVLAPHADDDVIGCGGTLCKHVEADDQVMVAYMTDGSRGSTELRESLNLVATRKSEAQNAAAVLGIKNLRFLGFQDQKLSYYLEDCSAVLADILIDYEPDLIYLPFPLDYNPDHAAAARIAVRAFERIDYLCRIMAYEIAPPIMPNRIVDISKEAEQKKKALRCHKSQMAQNDYVNVMIEGLNRYRTHGLLKGKGYAEAFFECDGDYLAFLIKRLNEF